MKPKKPTLEDQLAFISAQHEIFPTELFDGLVEAKQSQGKVEIGKLTIEYRGNIKDQAIFLITKDGAVIAQFRVQDDTLARTDVSFDSSMESGRIRKEIAKQSPTPNQLKIADLRVGMKKINISGDVTEVSNPTKVHTQFRDNAVVSNAVIEDETGKFCFAYGTNKLTLSQQATTWKLKTHMSPALKVKNNYD